MTKGLKYIVIIFLIIIIILVAVNFYKMHNKSKGNGNTINSAKVFEEPQSIIYQVKGKEKFKLEKDDKEYDILLEKLNSSLVEGYTSREKAYKRGYTVGLVIINIQEEIYSKNSLLRLFYTDTNEIDIIFEEDSVLDIIYIEDGKTDCFYGFDNKVQDEIKEYVDNI